MKRGILFFAILFFTWVGISEAQAQRVRPLQKARPVRAERITPDAPGGPRAIGIMIAQGRPEKEVIKNWENLIRLRKREKQPIDIYNLVQHVLREAYSEMCRDMLHYSSKVQQFNNMKKKIREELKKLRRSRAIKPWKPSREIRRNDLVMGPQWHIKLIQGRRIHNIAVLDEAIRDWEEKLAAIGDDAQLANIDLQNMLQKQQQTIQMLSNISKVLHDTALAVIRKIG